MKRYIALLMLLNCLHIMAADSAETEAYTLSSIAHVRISRAADLALDPKSTNAVTCMDLKGDGFLKIDSVSGKILSRHLKRDFNPQKLFWDDNRLLLLTDTSRTPECRVLDSESFAVLNTYPLADWRLYRITSATLTSDGGRIWMGTMPTSSSLYGEVDSALFCLNVSNGDCLRVAGNPPDKMYTGHPRGKRSSWIVCADDTGGVLATDPKERSVIAYPETHKNPKKLAQLGFTPMALPRKCKRYLPVAGEDRLNVIDLKSGISIGKIPFKGKPLSVCVDEQGTTAFVSTADSSTLLQFDLPSLKSINPIDLSRPKGVSGIADATRGKDVSDIVELRWASNPDRIIAFGYDGYIFITTRLEKQEQTEPKDALDKK